MHLAITGGLLNLATFIAVEDIFFGVDRVGQMIDLNVALLFIQNIGPNR